MKKTSVRARLLKLNSAMVALIVLIGILAVGQVLSFARALNGLMVDNYKSIRSFFTNVDPMRRTENRFAAIFARRR